MNDNQKDRLLKLAENNPDIAKDVVDILKQENQASNEPVEVKVVEQKREKIQITDDQKKYAKASLSSFVAIPLLFLLFAIILFQVNNHMTDPPIAIIFIAFFISFMVLVISAVTFQIKAGLPTLKVIFNRYFNI